MNIFRLAIKILGQPSRVRARIKRLLLYVSRFGMMRGLKTLFTVLRSRGPLIHISIPQLKAPVIVRAGTSDIPTFEQIFLWEEYDLPVRAEPKLIIDGGANVGYASVYFANRYPNAQIIAVEPERSNFEILRQNATPYPNISILQAGIWHKKTSLIIENPQDEPWEFRVQESSVVEGAIESVTITDLLELANASVIDILKLDIEGAEKEVFSFNYSAWLKRVNLLIVELHDRYKPGCSAAFYSATSTGEFMESQKGENIILVRKQLEKAQALSQTHHVKNA